MAGRFPFDPNNNNSNAARVTNAQMRAALGLPSVDELSANLYAEQQQRLEAQQRDFRYRNALYQDQLDHQLQELQMRANAVAELEQLPDLQQHYANIFLSERFGRGAEHMDPQTAAAYRARAAAAAAAQQEQQYGVPGSTSVAPPAHAAAYAHNAHQASVQAAAAAAAQLRYQEELRQQQQQQQQQQHQTAALQAHLRGAPPPTTVSGLEQLVMRNANNSGTAVPLPAPPTPVAHVPAAPVAPVMASAVPVAAPTNPPVASSESVEGSVSEGTAERTSVSRKNSVDSVEMEDYVIEQHKRQYPEPRSGHGGKKEKSKSSRASHDHSSEPKLSQDQQQKAASKRKRGRPRKPVDIAPTSKVSHNNKKNKKEVVDEGEQKMRAEAILQAMEERAAGMRVEPEPAAVGEYQQEREQVIAAPAKEQVVVDDDSDVKVDEENVVLAEEVAPFVSARQEPLFPRWGTVSGLLEAANSNEKFFVATHVLDALKTVEWPDSEDEEDKKPQAVVEEKPPATPSPEQYGLVLPDRPSQSIITSMMESHFPRLPEEPVYDEEAIEISEEVSSAEKENQMETDKPKGDEDSEHEDQAAAKAEVETKKGKTERAEDETAEEPQRKSNILDYPYPVDTWWPSSAGRRRERRHAGETSDEDAFEDPRDQDPEPPTLRVNERKIVERLQTELEPGFLEKIPHCRIHRIKRKSAGSLAELVYCFQVTECYPGEMMVCCSVCGTWRHAACGGHHEPYSTRKNIDEPFVAVCEQCHEEQRLLKDFPLARARIERQRMEQLRRGLATTAVMRSMSFSKHGGTYKWPLGSVSATHVGGHTRSVQARHDKAEKQWADLLTRLGRGYGYRTKERQRVRTKELERLLVAIEDAEGQTDRHNMLLFLMRDTKKPVPAGFEEEHKNLFDPCYNDEEFDSLGYKPTIRRSDSQKQKKPAAGDSTTDDGGDPNTDEKRECLRENCNKTARFDSRFCSDGCGVHVLELDLLQAFYESNDIHPSVLRSHY
ncbi:hypothetical protein ACA910_000740 [Epithemia clementina (nom. ined.)]